jgi:hypothetical protein
LLAFEPIPGSLSGATDQEGWSTAASAKSATIAKITGKFMAENTWFAPDDNEIPFRWTDENYFPMMTLMSAGRLDGGRSGRNRFLGGRNPPLIY